MHARARTHDTSIDFYLTARVSRLSPYFQRSRTDLKLFFFPSLPLSCPRGVFSATRRNLARNYPAFWFPPEKRRNNKPRYVDKLHAMRATRISDVRLIIFASASVKDTLCMLPKIIGRSPDRYRTKSLSNSPAECSSKYRRRFYERCRKNALANRDGYRKCMAPDYSWSYAYQKQGQDGNSKKIQMRLTRQDN